jgi:uncharacterized protein
MSTSYAVPRRIESIDILRGFTLFGIALIHMVEQYYAGQPPEAVANAESTSIPDIVVQGFTTIFIMGKFYVIFSFLFGLSFYMQYAKKNDDEAFLVRFAWRLVILFGIGMIHHLHYRGDILTIYAILGVGLFIFHRLSDKALLIVALVLVTNVPSLFVRMYGLFFVPGEPAFFSTPQDELMAYYNTVKNGSYLEILKANFHSFGYKMDAQFVSGRIYITLGLFLLGIYAGRNRLFERVTELLPKLKKSIRVGLWTMGGSILFAALILGPIGATGNMTMEIGFLFGGLAMDTFNLGMSVVYIAGILVLLQKEQWASRLKIFYPVGKMGLTTYLLQTAAGTLIMFSYGLGLLFELGAAWCLLIGAAVFALQIALAHVWLRYFEYGPVEWLWRMLTYLKWFPLSKFRQLKPEAIS